MLIKHLVDDNLAFAQNSTPVHRSCKLSSYCSSNPQLSFYWAMAP